MSKRRHLQGLTIAGALLLVGPGIGSTRALPQSGPLFIAAPAPRLPDHDPDATTLRVRYVRIDNQLLADLQVMYRRSRAPAMLSLNLFTDVLLTSVIDQVEPIPGGSVLKGYIEQEEESAVVLVFNGEVLSGSITMPRAAYHVGYTPYGLHAIREIDRHAYPPEQEPIPVAFEPRRTVARGRVPDDGSIFDLLVVYTAEARAAAGGTSAIETLIQLGVTETNQAYQNSEIIPRLRLVHMQEVVYTEDSDGGVNLSRLRNTSDGYLDEVHALRDAYGADLVKLVTNGPSGFCGVAYLMNGNSPGFASSAFSVTRRTCISPNYTFGHEIGHNLGCKHAPDDPGSSGGAYSYSFGYKDPGSVFRTIMAYNDACSCTRVLYHSNPNVFRNGLTTGTAGQNNALSINNVRTTVANFRVSTLFQVYLPAVVKP